MDFNLINWHLTQWRKLKGKDKKKLGFYDKISQESLPRVLKQDVEELVASLIASDPSSAVYSKEIRVKAGNLVNEIVKEL